jgi:acyl carrier protein
MTFIDTELDAAVATPSIPPTGGAATFDAFVELVGQIAPIDLDAVALTRDSTLAGDLMLDSISLISLMALSEAHFGIALSAHTEAVANLRTLGDAVDLVARLDAARA